MAKRKRSQKGMARVTSQRGLSVNTGFSDVEEAFFASAPPDEPLIVPPEQFDDDLVPPTSQRHDWERLLDQFFAALPIPQLDRRLITIAIASVMLLIGLSAVVFASLH